MNKLVTAAKPNVWRTRNKFQYI